MHHFLGIELHGQTWKLIEKKDRTPLEDATMVHVAKGSLYHWKEASDFKPANKQRGEWLVARAFAVLGEAELCLEHAKRCLQLTEDGKKDMEEFDIAFAHESVARAHALSGNKDEARAQRKLALEAGKAISDPEERKVFDEDFAGGDWYGLDATN